MDYIYIWIIRKKGIEDRVIANEDLYFAAIFKYGLLALGLLQILRICLLFRTGVSVYIYISIYLFPVSVYTNFQDAVQPYSQCYKTRGELQTFQSF